MYGRVGGVVLDSGLVSAMSCTGKFDLLPGIYLEPSTKPQANLIREHTYTHRPASRSKRARCAYQRRLGGGVPSNFLKKLIVHFLYYYSYTSFGVSIFYLTSSLKKKNNGSTCLQLATSKLLVFLNLPLSVIVFSKL